MNPIEPTPMEMETIRQVSGMIMAGLKEGSISLDEPSVVHVGDWIVWIESNDTHFRIRHDYAKSMDTSRFPPMPIV